MTSCLPLSTAHRSVAAYAGGYKTKNLSCLEQFLCLAFVQLTYRESLRDIEACLRAQGDTLYHMGIHSRSPRSALADANAVRDWRIYVSLGRRLLAIARDLYIDEPFGVDRKETAYALAAITIDLCLSVYPWAQCRTAKTAVKRHTLLDLRGNIPACIRISDVLAQRVPESGTFCVMDRGYLDLERLLCLHAAGSCFVTRGTASRKAHRRYLRPVDRTTGLVCDEVIVLAGFYARQAFDIPLR